MKYFTFSMGIFSILSLSSFSSSIGVVAGSFSLGNDFWFFFSSFPHLSLSSCALPHPPEPLFSALPSHPSRFSCFPMFPGLSFGSPALSSCLALPHGAFGLGWTPCPLPCQASALCPGLEPGYSLLLLLQSQPLPSAPSLASADLQQLAPSRPRAFSFGPCPLPPGLSRPRSSPFPDPGPALLIAWDRFPALSSCSPGQQGSSPRVALSPLPPSPGPRQLLLPPFGQTLPLIAALLPWGPPSCWASASSVRSFPPW